MLEVEPQTLWDGNDGRGRRIAPDALRWLSLHAATAAQPRRRVPGGRDLPPGPRRRGGRGALGPRGRGVALGASTSPSTGWDRRVRALRRLPPAAGADPGVGGRRGRARRALPGPLDRPFLVETPTVYVRATPGDLTDGEYVAAVALGADCGILLDLHNIWANGLPNGRQRVEDFPREHPARPGP